MRTSSPLIEPTVPGVQDIARRLKQGQTIALPTECTYESVSVNKNIPIVHQLGLQPHVYVTEKSLGELFESNATLFPMRKYAYRKDGKVQGMASFNEAFEVTRRLAPKIWPGPVVVAIVVPEAANDTTTNETMTHAEHEHEKYIQLRSPCHPLAVKSLQEYQYHDAAASDADSTESVVLIGRPMVQKTSSSTYLTTAASCLDHGISTEAVLNGESPQELFHVPTCERGQPPLRVIVDVSKRQVQVTCNSYLHLLERTLRPTTAPNAPMHHRMLQAVLFKWNVVVVPDVNSCSVEAE
jgi:hypothetical protein